MCIYIWIYAHTIYVYIAHISALFYRRWNFHFKNIRFSLSFTIILIQRLIVSFLCHHDNFLTVANAYKLLVFKSAFNISSQVFNLKRSENMLVLCLNALTSFRFPQYKAKVLRLITYKPSMISPCSCTRQ